MLQETVYVNDGEQRAHDATLRRAAFAAPAAAHAPRPGAIPLFDRCLLPRWTRRVHVSIAFTADYTIIMFGFDSDKDKSSSVRKPSKSVN